MGRLKRLIGRCWGSRVAPDVAARRAMVGPPELWEMKRSFQFAFLAQAGLQPQDHLLDIGCGTLRGGIPLIAYLEKGHYTGIDVRTDALAEAREELRSAGLCEKSPRLLRVDEWRNLALPETFDVMWAFSVFIHMADEVLESCLGFVGKHLSEGGVLYANVNLGGESAGRWQEFPCLWRELSAYRKLAGEHGLGIVDLGMLREHGHESGRPEHDTQHMLKFTRALPAEPGSDDAAVRRVRNPGTP